MDDAIGLVLVHAEEDEVASEIAGLRRSRVRVEARLDGTVWARVGEKTVRIERCADRLPELQLKQPAQTRKDHNRDGRSGWMNHFDLQKGRPGWEAAWIANRVG